MIFCGRSRILPNVPVAGGDGEEPRALFSDIDTPALIADTGRLRSNISHMAETARRADLKLRPHTKTHKCVELARMQLDAGAAGITVAKLGEAEVMADADIADILIANLVVGSTKIERLLALAKRADVLVCVDSLDVANPLSSAFAAAGMRLPVLIEVEVGAQRCGIPPGEAEGLVREVVSLAGLRLAGLLTYPGHAYDAASSKEIAAIADAECDTARAVSGRLASMVDARGHISGGTTPTATHYRPGCGLTEIRAGSYVFCDRACVDAWSGEPSDCALTVLATVISVRDKESAILDAGLKALGKDPVPRSPGLGMLKEDNSAVVSKLNEEHAFLDLSRSNLRLCPGDVVEVIPNSAGTVVNLFDEIHLVEDGEVADTWRIAARGRSR
jgi:D-serine deaminase-like pyridoxal phosphate-dependent protein